MSQLILYNGNSQIVTGSGLKDNSQTPPAPLNNAVLTATLKDRTGASVTGVVNVPGTYVASSNGVYRFALSTPLNTPPGLYTFMIDGTGAGATYHEEVPTVVKTYTGQQ